MNSKGGYNFDSMSGNDQVLEPEAEKEVEKEPAPIIKVVAMVSSGLLGLMVSPYLFAIFGLIGGLTTTILIFTAIGLAGVSGYLGERMIKKGAKIGWIGIVLMSLIIIKVIGPIILVFII